MSSNTNENNAAYLYRLQNATNIDFAAKFRYIQPLSSLTADRYGM
jgi:hypothetical protein